jgi:hypothetical protein
MKLKLVIMLSVVILFAISADRTLAGGGKRNGTAGANELLIPVGAQNFGMNGSYISGATGVEAIYYNPAGIIGGESGVEVLFSSMKQIGDINVSYGAVSARLGDIGSIGFSVKSLNFGDIPVTTVANESGDGTTFSPTYVTITGSYSTNLTDHIRVGTSFKLITEKIVSTSATGFAVDAGVQYLNFAGFEGVGFGVTLKNFGTQMKFDGSDLLRNAQEANVLRGYQYYQIVAADFSLPSQLEIGASYERKITDDFKGLITATYQDNSFLNDEYKIGAEVSYLGEFFIRGGYSFVPQSIGDDDNIYGPTFGAGFKIDTGVKISIDYAYRQLRYFDANHMFSIRLGF